MSDFFNRMFNQTMVPNTPSSSRKMKREEEEIVSVPVSSAPIREMPMIRRNEYFSAKEEKGEEEEEEEEDLFDLDVNDEDVRQVRENSLALVGGPLVGEPVRVEREEEEEVASPENKYCFY